MKISIPKGKQLRFEAYLYRAENQNRIPFTIYPHATVVTNDSDYPVGLTCRYRVNALNSENDELIGYLHETTCSVIAFGTKETDLRVLTAFCSDAFISVEIDFQQKIRLPYNIFGHTRPQFDRMGESLLGQLVALGCY